MILVTHDYYRAYLYVQVYLWITSSLSNGHLILCTSIFIWTSERQLRHLKCKPIPTRQPHSTSQVLFFTHKSLCCLPSVFTRKPL